MERVHDLPDGRAVPDLGGGYPGCGQEFGDGLLGLGPLPPGAGEVGVHASLAFDGGELVGMEVPAGFQGCACVAEGPVDADGVEVYGGGGDGEETADGGNGGQVPGGARGFLDEGQGLVAVLGDSGGVGTAAEHLGERGGLGAGGQAGGLHARDGGFDVLLGSDFLALVAQDGGEFAGGGGCGEGEPDTSA